MNPLFELAAAAIDFIARLMRRRSSRNESLPFSPAAATGEMPIPATSSWHNRFGGRAWRYDGAGVYTRGHGEDHRPWRTAGAPVTCRAILERYGAIILWAAEKHGVNPALILMTIATETAATRAHGFTGPATFRWEAHVLNRDVTQAFRGTYSAGPMQILATTARDLIATRGGEYALGHAPFATAPALRERPAAAPTGLPLYDPRTNIELGTAVIRRQLQLTGDDPVLVAAVYNAGGIYESSANPWRLRSHGNHLDRAARWYGDACVALREAGTV